jgi:SAM-dependent methyltransferase
MSEDSEVFLPSVYTDGSYLEKTGGTWHLEDSPFKAGQVLRMLRRHPEIEARTILEIGCGAGGILSELQKLLGPDVVLTGYEISPQAHALSEQFANDRCKYILGDAFADPSVYDLVLVMDVVEHVEDCFSFLRRAKSRGRWKLYHIPLDAHASAILRGVNSWTAAGHLHLVTMETAIKSLERTGHCVVDYILTTGVFAQHNKALRTRLANLPRRALMKLSPRMVARLFGGLSMLILAE